MNGILQYVQSATLVAVTPADLEAQIATYAGPATSNGEHIDEAYQRFVVYANALSLPTGTALTFYYFWNNNAGELAVIAGPSGMLSTDYYQPEYVRLDLVIGSAGNIRFAGELSNSRHAFPPAAPYTPTFGFN